MKTIACTVPFTSLQIGTQGFVYLCCPAWTTYGPVGRLTDATTLDDIWNSDKSQFVRRCIYKKQLHKVCNMKYCPYALAGNHVRLETKDPAYQGVYGEMRLRKTTLVTAPRKLILAHSGRCNLRCTMCWSNEDYVKEDTHLNDIIFNRELPRMLPRLSEIILTGNGDPFAMKDTREFLQQFNPHTYPLVLFSIITNGQLFNAFMWKTIRHNNFGWINVSIDGATKDTYERIRRGGKWEILQKNLKLISNLRKKNRFSSFEISFVVMKSNYHEMKQFVQMGLALKADRITFQKVFGLIAGEENINITQNKKIFIEIARMLSDPIFRHPAVDLSLIKEYVGYQNKSVTNTERITTATLGRVAQYMSTLRIMKNRDLRSAGIWVKSTIPQVRAMLGW